MMKKIILYIFLLTAFVFPQSNAKPPINLEIAKHDVINYYKSGNFHKNVTAIIDKAIKKFDAIKPAKNDAVVFDIDETTLSSYNFYLKVDFGYIPKLWDTWINSAKIPPLKEVQRLYDYLVSRGFRIIFLTGRSYRIYKPTYKNLINAGYTKFDTLITRNLQQYKLTALKYKSEERTVMTKKGYHIVGDVGDQLSDINGPYHGIQVKIPNYIYVIY